MAEAMTQQVTTQQDKVLEVMAMEPPNPIGALSDKTPHTTTDTSKRGFLPVAAPVFAGNEKLYVNQCLDTTWISSRGEFIDRFEKGFAQFCGVQHAIATNNGTTALHVALLALGIGPGDEVIVPTLTFVASANAVMYCGATPVFVDIEAATWNLDLNRLEAAITPRTKAIMVVHLFGHPVDMDPVMEIAARHRLSVIEDAAEAHGAAYKGRVVGGIGHLATFSFYGNKIITTGEGGMVTTNDPTLARKVMMLKGQGQDFEKRYWFPIIGYNYRMTNIQAALGLAQLEQIEWHLGRRRENGRWYRDAFSAHPQFALQVEQPWAKSAYWINSVVLPDALPISRDEVMSRLNTLGIETRPFFYPMHILPMYAGLIGEQRFPVADSIAARGMNLPSSGNLTRDDVDYVVQAIVDVCK
jgi:perosamine synthetase